MGSRRFPVLFVNLSRGWGGGEAWHLTLLRALSEREWLVGLLAWPGADLARRAESAGIPVWPMKLRAASLVNPVAMQRLGAELNARRPGAVILAGVPELLTAGLLSHWLRIPQVIFRQEAAAPLPSGIVSRWLLGRAVTRIVGDSQAALDALAAEIPEPAQRLRPRIVRGGIDPAPWQPAGERAPAGRIVALGPLEWGHGMDIALQALRPLRQRMAHATLRIAGEGSQRANLAALAEALGVAGAVEFAGGAADVHAALRDGDVFVLPARAADCESALVEAMLMGLPVVAFDHPAAREAVRDGETGLLAPAGDTEALADALAVMLAAPDRARMMGLAGRARALEQFTVGRAAADLERVLLDEDGA
jgi:glycosyltransferase involved in cell wall biosynthesis